MFLVYGKRRTELLTDSERSLYACLTEKIGLNPHRILFHVPLSQVIDPKTIDDRKSRNLVFLSTLPLVLLDLPRQAKVSGVGLYSDQNKEISILLRRKGIPVFKLATKAKADCNSFVDILDNLRKEDSTRPLVNRSEFGIKQELEISLRGMLSEQFYSQRNSFLRTLQGIDGIGVEFLDMQGFVYGGKDPSLPIEALHRIETLIKQDRDRYIKENGDPYRDFYFLHEFSISRLIEELPLADQYDNVSGYWKDRIREIASRRLNSKEAVAASKKTTKAHPRIQDRRLQESERRVHEEIVGASQKFNEFLRKTAIDVLVLNPDAQPVVAVEFDGPDHDKPKQKEKDEWKDVALAQLGIPCIRVPYSQRTCRSAKSPRTDVVIEKQSKLYFAFVFTFFVERLHRKREARRRRNEVERNIDRYVDRSIAQQRELESDPALSMLLADVDRKAGEMVPKEMGKCQSNTSRSFEELDETDRQIQFSIIDEILFEADTSVGNDEGLIEEIVDTTRVKESYLKKAYSENCLDMKVCKENEEGTIKAVLSVKNDRGRAIGTRELSLRPLPGSWGWCVGGRVRNRLNSAFLYAQLVDQAYQSMIHYFRKKS